MKIALASEDNQGLGGILCTNCGRCPYYTLVDLDGDRLRHIETVTNQYLESNASMIPMFIRSQGARVIIGGGMEARVIELFEQFGIEVVSTRTHGKLKDILLAYLRGEI